MLSLQVSIMKKMTFEAAESRLNELIKLLSNSNTPLDEALSLFEEGIGLIKYSNKMLDEAEQKVKVISEI